MLRLKTCASALFLMLAASAVYTAIEKEPLSEYASRRARVAAEIKGKALNQLTEILSQEHYLKKGKSFQNTFNEFIGNENFEERADPEAKWIDRPVLKYLVKKFLG